ncbi:hypothetical protein [Streptomyces sp. NBC_01750]|uniref:hypothetical protein n=1 Tax=Streptomyces sp. NBC_01750 TaxID=2975928 RepID=UPI002DD975E2|nr:hypothetical protein [Streptomyces sp. NBC_01750]WSD35939.1 hypothetical protein OG966_30975 [Streptomyces sp. NBC_01750]
MVRQEEWVEQIVFRWDADNASGTTGFGPVAWSCGPEQADGVFRSAAALLRATGEDTVPALVRLERDGSALLLHRTPWRDAGGSTSTVCHALLGSSQVLDPDTCLGLHDWSWEGSELALGEVRGALDQVRQAALLPSALEGQGRLAATLAGVEEELTGAAAEFLRHPRQRFTLLDRQGGDSACRVLWGMAGIFSGLVPRGWTFATHDTAETAALRFVFVRSWPGSAAQDTQRLRTDPRERCRDRAEELAAELVRHHLRGVAQGDGREFEVDRALRTVATQRAGNGAGGRTLLDTVERALSALDGAGRGHGGRRAEEHRPPPWEEEPGRESPAREPYDGREPHTQHQHQAPTQHQPHAQQHDQPYTQHQHQAPTQHQPHAQQHDQPYTQQQHQAPTHHQPHPQQPLATHQPLPAQPPYPVSHAVSPAVSRPAESEVRIVPAEWKAPQASRPRLPRLPRLRRRGRRPTVDYQYLLTVLSVFPERYTGPGDARELVRGAVDGDLIRALRAGIPYEAVTLLMAEIAERWPYWHHRLRRGLRDTVLDLDLFLAGQPGPGGGGDGPGDEIRAANAASLYRWVVRPLLDDPRPKARLTELLPRLSTGSDRAGRAAVRQIVAAERPGLPETTWLALLRAAHGGYEPSVVVGSAHDARATPRSLPDQPPPPSAPAARDPDRPSAQDGRLVVVVLAAVLVVAVVLIVMLMSVM